MLLLILRNNVSISNDVIDKVCTSASGVAEIVDLNGRGAMREYSDAIAARKPGQIDGNIDVELNQQLVDVAIRPVSSIDKVFKRISQLYLHRALNVSI